jgi:hypothetical protein
MKSIFFWDMTPCSAKMEEIRSSETSGTTQGTTRRHIPEEDTLQNHRCENLKSYTHEIFSITESSQERPDHGSDGELGQGEGRGDAGQDTQAMVALDNKHNLAQREQYYAAVQKGIATHTVERVPGEFP